MGNKKILIIICISLFILVIGIIFIFNMPKRSYAANSLYEAVQTDVLDSGYGGLYGGGTNDCYSVNSPNISTIDTACDSDTTSLYCAVKKDAMNNSYGGVYTGGTNDCYSIDTPNTIVLTTTYKVTIYYQSNSTSGSTTISSTEISCETSSDSCTTTIPSVVRSSVGTYNNSYAGLSTSTGTMNASVGSNATSITLTGDATYYAIYRSSVQNYYYGN